MSKEIYKEIADKILKALEGGVRPWVQCYAVSKGGFAKRVTGADYRGTNRFLLTIEQWEKGYSSNVWMTYNQARKLKANVRKGEKSSLSLFYRKITKKDDKTGEEETYAAVRRTPVFNADQIDNLPEGFLDKFIEPLPEYDNTPSERADSFIKNIPAVIETKDTIPCFIPSLDKIHMPAIKQFKTAEQYYGTALHELVHYSGAKKRLNRIFKYDTDKKNYHAEELTAELGAAMLLPSVGIRPLVDEEHAPYLAGYIKLLKEDPQAFVKACSKAEEAADYLKSFQKEASKQEAA
jgi:antirestriction protein ArdC